MRVRTMIIDDEELARIRLRKLLQTYEPEIEIVGEAANGNEAVRNIIAAEPDLIFLDVQMPGCDGFEVVRRLTTKPFIVFATAFDAYALKAFEENSVDYLLKPIDRKRLGKTVEKLRLLFDTPAVHSKANIERMLSRLLAPSLQRLQVKTGEKILLIDLCEVVYFEARDKYTFLHTAEKEYLIDDTLAELELKLDAAAFIRIHRSVIVNVRFIRELVKWFAGRYKMRMKDVKGTELVVSRGYAEKVRAP